MPRPGGVPDKLGNQYEAVWTVEVAIDVFAGRFQAITVEPFGKKLKGIEFYLEKLDNTLQFHSVKRQKQKGDWSVADLCRTNKSTGRSILGDLFNKREEYPYAETRFVSSTDTNALRELTERAEAPRDAEEFTREVSRTKFSETSAQRNWKSSSTTSAKKCVKKWRPRSFRCRGRGFWN